jgi:rhodanese-related sulfurtransferase
MKRTAALLSAALAFAVPSFAFACDGMEGHQAAAEPKAVTVEQVASLTKAKQATPVDANGDKTRTNEGVIPGAILLTSSMNFNAAKELPANKDSQLVFYCASEKCGASKQAARKAIDAGYTNVAVMPAGITGWKKAGQPTSKPNS